MTIYFSPLAPPVLPEVGVELSGAEAEAAGVLGAADIAGVYR